MTKCKKVIPTRDIPYDLTGLDPQVWGNIKREVVEHVSTYMCPLCPYITQNRAALNTHGCKAHESTVLACAYCEAGPWWQGAAWASHLDSIHPQLDLFPIYSQPRCFRGRGRSFPF